MAFETVSALVETARSTFIESLPRVSADPDDPFTQANQERRLGAMFRAYAGWHRWFSDWQDAVAHIPTVLAFGNDRLKVQQREAGVRHDLIDAVFALGGEDDLVRLLARVKALQGFVETSDGADLLAGYRRAANILRKEGVKFSSSRHPRLDPGSRFSTVEGSGTPDQVRGDEEGAGVASVDWGYEPEPAERALAVAIDTQLPLVAAAIDGERFGDAMGALAALRAPIDAFFEGVIVNDADPERRTARLALLARLVAAMHNVADFSKIEG